MRTSRRFRVSALAAIIVAAVSASGAMTATAGLPERTWEDGGADLYRGEVEVVRTAGHPARTNSEGEPLLSGTVFVDADRDGTQDRRERGVAGVLVSNGRDVVKTDRQGRYTVAAFENSTITMTQPAGYQVPVDDDNVAQFFYHHLPQGSPELRYGGLEPTGPLPSAVNFPLVKSRATADRDQNCVIAGDLQTYNTAEVGYARDGAIKDLAGRDDFPGCGVLFIGDVVGDDLSLYSHVRDLVGQIDAPIRFLPGNHDLDFDAETAEHSFDTFRAQLAPEYFSYDVGQVHVVALNTVRYPCTPDVDNADGKHPECNNPEGQPRYNGRLSDNQLAWLEADLAQVPENKLVLLAAHIPLLTFADEGSYIHQVDQVEQVYDIVGDRPAVAVAGHTHSIENLSPGDTFKGWVDNFGIDELPFRHITSGAISGDWYSGALTPEG
ncbi:MAG: metallophosphoesterase, partial [Actinomycetota bacterium]|nr:metallophosphoesterase [Actinomycetota bacterium]